METEKWTESDVEKLFTNPFYCINFSDSLFGQHQPMITEEEWIRVQIKLIKDMGQEKYFKTLLDSIKNPLTSGDYPTTYGYTPGSEE